MTLAEAIYAHLLANAGVAAIAGTRVYPSGLPQLEKDVALEPSLVFSLSGREDEFELSGIAQRQPRWTMFSVAEAYDDAHALADAVEEAFMPGGVPFQGDMGLPPGVHLEHVRLLDAFDAPEPTLGLHVVQQEYSFGQPHNQ